MQRDRGGHGPPRRRTTSPQNVASPLHAQLPSHRRHILVRKLPSPPADAPSLHPLLPQKVPSRASRRRPQPARVASETPGRSRPRSVRPGPSPGRGIVHRTPRRKACLRGAEGGSRRSRGSSSGTSPKGLRGRAGSLRGPHFAVQRSRRPFSSRVGPLSSPIGRCAARPMTPTSADRSTRAGRLQAPSQSCLKAPSSSSRSAPGRGRTRCPVAAPSSAWSSRR
jgi:hypothetical protein